jgi:hypothetical protein
MFDLHTLTSMLASNDVLVCLLLITAYLAIGCGESVNGVATNSEA